MVLFMLHQFQLAEEIGAVEVGSLQRYGRPAQEVSLVAVVATLIEVGTQRLGSLIQTEHLKGDNLGQPPLLALTTTVVRLMLQ